MDILGEARLLLKRFAVPAYENVAQLSPLEAFALREGGQGPVHPSRVGLEFPARQRSVYEFLEITCALRLDLTEFMQEYAIARRGQALNRALYEAERQPGRTLIYLWDHWISMLECDGGLELPQYILDGKWTSGMAPVPPGKPAPLHELTSETLLDAFVYDELCTLHAAYAAAARTKNAGRLGQVRQVVQWHVENTQPDNTTFEPWALAAFAALDDSGTFAAQQLHDTRTHLERSGPSPIVLALLADAIVTGARG